MRRALIVTSFTSSYAALCLGQAPQLRANYTEVATLAASPVGEVLPSPSGRFVLYSTPTSNTENELRVFDRVSRTSKAIGRAHADYAWSPRGDMLAYAAIDDRRNWLYVWTMRLNPETAMPVGPPRRISLTPGRGPEFSPDGSAIAFTTIPPTDTSAPRIIIVPVNGGEERVLVHAPGYAQELNWTASEMIYYRYHSSWSPSDMVITANRVAAKGGAPQTLRQVGDVVGLSRDGKFVAYRPPGSFDAEHPIVGISTDDGVELGRIALPRFFEPQAWSSSRRLLAVRNERPTGLSMVNLRGGAPVELTGGEAYDAVAAFSPDGRQLAFVSYVHDRRQLVLMPAAGGDRRILSTQAEPDRSRIRWSPDARYLVFTSGGLQQLHVVDVNTNVETRVNASGTIDWDAFAWRRDAGAVFALTTTDQRKEIVEVTLGGISRRIRMLPRSFGSYVPVTFVGDTLCLIAGGDTVFVGDMRGGALRKLFVPPAGTAAGWLYGVEVSHDGRLAALSVRNREPQFDQSVYIVPLNGDAPRTLPLNRLALRSRLYWHPDGFHLVAMAMREEADGLSDVFLIPLSGEPLRSLTPATPGGRVRDFTLRPNGESIVFTRWMPTRASLWEIDLAQTLEGYGRP